MPFYKSTVPKWALFSLIGLFLIGGVIITYPKLSLATDFISQLVNSSEIDTYATPSGQAIGAFSYTAIATGDIQFVDVYLSISQNTQFSSPKSFDGLFLKVICPSGTFNYFWNKSTYPFEGTYSPTLIEGLPLSENSATPSIPVTMGDSCNFYFFPGDVAVNDPGGSYTGWSNIMAFASNGSVAYVRAYSGVPNDTSTHIVSMQPEDNETIISTGTTTPVDISLHAYINPDDLSTFAGIKVTFQNIDQNTLLSGLSPYSYTYLDRVTATSSGDFNFASTTPLPRGNYRVTASLEKTTVFGLINPFSGFLGTIDELSHQFVVGSSTWIGSQQQTLFKDTGSFFGGLAATSTEARAKSCNPLSDSFGIRECVGFLLIPDSSQLSTTMLSFREGVLIRVPWGYVTRFVDILSSQASTTLPSINVAFDSAGPLAGVTWNVHPGEILAAGGDFMASTKDKDGNNLKDILEPVIKLIVGLALVFQIVHDLTGSHTHHSDRNKQMT